MAGRDLCVRPFSASSSRSIGAAPSRRQRPATAGPSSSTRRLCHRTSVHVCAQRPPFASRLAPADDPRYPAAALLLPHSPVPFLSAVLVDDVRSTTLPLLRVTLPGLELRYEARTLATRADDFDVAAQAMAAAAAAAAAASAAEAAAAVGYDNGSLALLDETSTSLHAGVSLEVDLYAEALACWEPLLERWRLAAVVATVAEAIPAAMAAPPPAAGQARRAHGKDAHGKAAVPLCQLVRPGGDMTALLQR